jgi:hypothetical protein
MGSKGRAAAVSYFFAIRRWYVTIAQWFLAEAKDHSAHPSDRSAWLSASGWKATGRHCLARRPLRISPFFLRHRNAAGV